MGVYEKVRTYIVENGLSWEFISGQTGISVCDFKAILNGKKVLYADELRKICLALNVSPELFIETDKNKSKRGVKK